MKLEISLSYYELKQNNHEVTVIRCYYIKGKRVCISEAHK
jgi:hypothetical protein